MRTLFYCLTASAALVTLIRAKGPFVNEDGFLELDLPPRGLVKSLLSSRYSPGRDGCTYTINDIGQAVNHAMGLLTMIKCAILPKHGVLLEFYSQHTPWLLDSLLSCNEARFAVSNSAAVTAAPIIQLSLDLLHTYGVLTDEISSTVAQKIYTLLAMLCSQTLTEIDGLVADNESGTSLRRVLCLAVIHLAKGAIKYKNVSMILSSRLMGPLHQLVMDNPIVGFETDFWVGQHLSTIGDPSNANRTCSEASSCLRRRPLIHRQPPSARMCGLADSPTNYSLARSNLC